MRAQDERTTWRGEGLHLEQVAEALDRAHRDLQRDGRGQALARTLNLVVAPTSAQGANAVEEALEQLGAHSPSRTLVLRRHGADRLDAEVLIECERPDTAGRVGICHDQVMLIADDGRLEHASSLLAPLLLRDLPTVLWLPEPDSPIPDGGLLERTQQVLVDSGGGDVVALRRFADLARSAACTTWPGAGWSSGALLPRPHSSRRSGGSCRRSSGGLTFATRGGAHRGVAAGGWIVARAGWTPGAVERRNGKARGTATRADGGQVSLSLTHDSHAGGCGGIESVTLHRRLGPGEDRPWRRDEPACGTCSRRRCSRRRPSPGLPGGAPGGAGHVGLLAVSPRASRLLSAWRSGGRRRSRRPGRPARRPRTAGGLCVANRWERMAMHDPLRIGLAQPCAESSTEDHRLHVEQVDRRGDPGPECPDGPVDELRRQLVARPSAPAPRCRSSAGRGRASS